MDKNKDLNVKLFVLLIIFSASFYLTNFLFNPYKDVAPSQHDIEYSELNISQENKSFH